MNEPREPHSENDASEAVDVVAVLIIALAVIVFFYLIHVVLLPFVFSAVTAFVLTPLVDWLAKSLRTPRIAVALAVFLGVLGLIGLGAYFAIPALVHDGYRAISNLQEVIQRLLENLLGKAPVQILGQPESASDIAAGAVAKLRSLLQQGGTVAALAAWAFGGVFGVFLTLTLFAYFLASGAQVVRGLVRLFPPDWRPVTARILESLRPILFRYFIGIAAVIVYAGCAAYVGLGLFLRLRHAAFLAALTGLLEVLPVVGPALSAVIAGLVAVQEAKSVWSIVTYVIYASALRLSIDQLIGPVVLGNAARVHPTLVIFCFLAGGALFGIVGVILAVPLALTVKVSLAAIYGEPIGGRK
ncbi:MAG TPA: AI-2E family transporter [Roseiarcus sp.]|jgi:predicted PurR-regulated permease PerM|nr:AI-2E family transporter [Roseiarcus sp.]